jgi:hypothetical protein
MSKFVVFFDVLVTTILALKGQVLAFVGWALNSIQLTELINVIVAYCFFALE